MRFLRNLFKNQSPILGRWHLKYDEHTINRVVFLANEDHCGCCYVDKIDEYYLPFII